MVWVTAIQAGNKCEDGVYSEGNTVTVCDGHGGKACMKFMLDQKFNFSGCDDPDEVVNIVKRANKTFFGRNDAKPLESGMVPGTTLTTVSVMLFSEQV